MIVEALRWCADGHAALMRWYEATIKRERARSWGVPVNTSDDERELCRHEALDVAEQREREQQETR